MSSAAHYRVGVRVDGSAAGLERAAKDGEDALKKLGVRSTADFKRMADARKVLNVKSEHELQREIQRTEAAYNRLTRSGTLTWREQRLAARAMRDEVTRLTNEMGRYTTRQKVMMGAKVGAAVVAGAGIATAMVAPKAQQAMAYDRRLADLANIAYAERDTAGRKSGMRDLDRLIVEALRYGGGTRDAAVDTAGKIFGVGIFTPSEVATILKDAMRASTATGAAASDFAEIAFASKSFGIRTDRMGAAFGIGTYGGQQGGFEIRDMARYLPSQLASATQIGMSGEKDFAKLVALNQAAVFTAGTRDEAGNNVKNLLMKIGSEETARNFKQDFGFDFAKELAEGRMRGMDALDVTANLLQRQLSKDRNYQAVQQQLNNAKGDDERRAALRSVESIAQGTVVAKAFKDMQALMALYGYLQNRKRVDEIASGALTNTDAANRNYELIAATPDFKVQQARNEAEIAYQRALDDLNPKIGTLADKTAALVREYPGYAVAITAATAGLTALAGSAAAAAAAAWLLRGRVGAAGGGPIIPPAAGGAASGAAKAASTAATAGAKAMGAVAKLGPWTSLAAGAASLFFTSEEEIAVLKRAEAMRHSRGHAFDDPRRLDARGASERIAPQGDPAKARSWMGARSAGERIAAATAYDPAAPLPLLQQDLRGEVLVRVEAAPGLHATAEAKSSTPRIPFRADVGRTMAGSGY